MFKIPAEDFLYMSRFTSTDPTRSYLAGVRVECYDGYCLLIATDGSRAGVMRLVSDKSTGEFVQQEPVTIPNDKNLLAVAKGKDRMLHYDHDTNNVLVYTDGDAKSNRTTFPLPDMGTYPDWRRVMPVGEPNGETTGYAYNVKFLKDFANGKSARIQIQPNGSGPATVVTTDDRFVGILMPIRYSVFNVDEHLKRIVG